MRRILVCLIAVIVTAFVWATLNPARTYAADASWTDSSTITYDGNEYRGPAQAQELTSLKLTEGTKAYIYFGTKPDTSGRSTEGATTAAPTTKRAYVIYFDKDTDVSTAKTANYKSADYVTIGNYSNFSSVSKINIDPTNSKTQKAGSSCSITGGLGWIICPVSNFLANSMDWIYDVVSSFLVVKPVASDPNTALFRAWSAMRSFANIAFVIGFLIIIYSQITNFGIDNYGIKRLLPRLIIAAILVNVSYYVCAIAVDISNVLGYSLQEVFVGIRNNLVGTESTSNLWNWTSMTGFILSGGTAAVAGTIGLTLTLSTYGVAGSIFLLLPVLMTGLLAVLTALLILAGRQALITVLIIISPLAFVAYLLPNTEKWFDKWRSTFMTLMVLFPAFSIIYGGSQLAAAVIIQNADNINLIILGMMVQVMPLAITPLLIKLSGNTLGQLANFAARFNKPLADRTRDFTKDRSENIKARRLGTVAERHQFLRRNAQAIDHRRRRREAWRGAHNNMADARWARSNDFSNVDQAVREAADNKSLGESMSELRYNTQRTIAGSRINRLDSQLRETKERLANTETRADNLYKESNAHRDLHEEAYRLDTRKNLIEQTLDRDLKVRVRDNAELLREEMAVRIRTDQAAIAQSELDNVHKRARAGYNTDGLLADDMVVNADVTARAQSISKLAGESAERVEKTNIYTDLANQANSAAALAGSIDPYGEERARASATAAIDKMNSENVAAASTLLSSQNYTPAELIAVARGRRRDGTRSTSEEQQAAAQQIIQIGYEPDMVQLINNTTMEAKAAAHAGIPNPDNVALQKALGSYLAGSSKKPKYFPGPMLGKLSRGEMVEDVGDLIASTFASEKLSMEVFGEMPVEEMQRITGQLASTSGRRKLTAAGALDTPAKKTAVIDTITDALADPIVSAKFTPAQAKALDDMLVELRSMP